MLTDGDRFDDMYLVIREGATLSLQWLAGNMDEVSVPWPRTRDIEVTFESDAN
jgi:hypothetical protein